MNLFKSHNTDANLRYWKYIQLGKQKYKIVKASKYFNLDAFFITNYKNL